MRNKNTLLQKGQLNKAALKFSLPISSYKPGTKFKLGKEIKKIQNKEKKQLIIDNTGKKARVFYLDFCLIEINSKIHLNDKISFRDHGTTNLLKVTNFKFTFDKLERIKGEDLPKDALHLLDENCPEEENLKKRKEREDNDENLYPKQKVSSPTLIFNTLLDEVSVLLNNSHCLNSPLQTENEFNQLFINEPQNEVTTHNVHTNTDNNPFCWATTHNVQRSNVLGENLNDEIHSLFISDNTFL